MPTLRAGDAEITLLLEVGQALTVVAPTGSTARIRDLSDQSPDSAVTGTTTIFGPYAATQNLRLGCSAGAVNYTLAAAVLGGSFTTLSASSTVSGTGFSSYLAAPPSIGTTAAGIVSTSELRASYTDSSGTPGNVTNNSPKGRAAFAAAGSTVVVTSTLVTAASAVLVQLGGSDATLTSVRVTAAAGSFTVTGNAAATGITPFSFLVIN